MRIIENLRIKATSSPMHIINENIFVFGLAGRPTSFSENIFKYIEIYLAITLQRVVQMT